LNTSEIKCEGLVLIAKNFFMLGNVYIVGLGMSLSEMDLWRLINCKKRNFPDKKVTLYKPDIQTEEKLLAEAYGVIVITDGNDGDYCAYYSDVCEKLLLSSTKIVFD
jgi:hypothetical protein